MALELLRFIEGGALWIYVIQQQVAGWNAHQIMLVRPISFVAAEPQ